MLFTAFLILFIDFTVKINRFGTNGADTSRTASPSKPRARLVTPSEKQARGEIPGNIFITSVELELDENGRSSWESRKRKKKGRDNWGRWENGEERNDLGYGIVGNNENISEIVLNYGEDIMEDVVDKVKLNLKEIEKGWDNYSEIKDASVLKEEDFILWKVGLDKFHIFTLYFILNLLTLLESFHKSDNTYARLDDWHRTHFSS